MTVANSAILNSSRNTKNLNKKKIKSNRFNLWIKNHLMAFIDSLEDLYKAPLSNILTMFTLGVALALPILLSMILVNLDNNIQVWQKDLYQYTLYLDKRSEQIDAEAVRNQINKWPEVNNVQIISKAQGLEELKSIMGIDDILNNIEHNPLPIVMVVDLKKEFQNLEIIKTLLNKSEDIAGVNKAQADIFWLEKVSNIFKLLSGAIYFFCMALGLAVFLVIANTIRLMLQSKQKEMTVLSLLGATNSFIRRPYLYGGACYGIFVGCLSLAVANYLFNTLYSNLDSLGMLALANLNWTSFSVIDSLLILLSSSLLGWLAARVTLFWQVRNLKAKLEEL